MSEAAPGTPALAEAQELPESHDQVLHAARRLFGERGYAATSIREIAAEAGVSPAMVMKVGGNKQRLHALATPLEPAPLDPSTPLDGIGELMVRRLFDRRDDEAAEPWLRALFLVQDAEDPAQARAELRQRLLGRFDSRDPVAQRRADQVGCLMLGLAAGVRALRLLPADRTDTDAAVREYGALVQGVIDSIPR